MSDKVTKTKTMQIRVTEDAYNRLRYKVFIDGGNIVTAASVVLIKSLPKVPKQKK